MQDGFHFPWRQANVHRFLPGIYFGEGNCRYSKTTRRAGTVQLYKRSEQMTGAGRNRRNFQLRGKFLARFLNCDQMIDLGRAVATAPTEPEARSDVSGQVVAERLIKSSLFARAASSWSTSHAISGSW